MTNKPHPDHEEWAKVWEARRRGLVSILGQDGEYVSHAPVPFELGGSADVIPFPQYVSGMTYATAELTGPGSCQHPNVLGHYELVICTQKENEAAAELISRLSRYTCDAKLEPMETMDIPNFFEDETIRGLLFANLKEPPPSFDVLGQKCGLLLCVGVTAEELKFTRKHGTEALLSALVEQKIFPYTIPDRPSVVLPK